MTVRPTTVSKVQFEHLESRRLLAIVNVTDHGATPNDGSNDALAIQNAINRSAAGDTINFPAGTYDVSNTLTFRGDRTYQGATGSKLQFNLSPRVGISVIANAANIIVKGMHFDGAGFHFGAGSGYSNIQIHGNKFTNIARHAIQITANSDLVTIECNLFQNVNGYGTLQTYNTNRMTVRYNRFIDVAHGGHILGPKNDVTIAYNHLTGISLFGFEVQSLGPSVSRNFTAEGNVIYDWRSTNSRSMGLSIPLEHGLNNRIINNYIRGNLAPGNSWLPDPGRHMAIGTMIEVGGDTNYVAGNVTGGTYWFNVGAGGVQQPPRYTNVIENNKFYGTSITRAAHIVPWPNSIGPASWTEGAGNIRDANQANMPAPDAWIAATACGAQPLPNPTPNPNPNPNPNPPGRIPAPSNLRLVRPESTNRVDLQYDDNSTNEYGFKIERSYIGPNGPFSQVGLNSANIVKWTNFGLPANKDIWYRVRAYGALGHSAYSNVLPVHTAALGSTPSSVGGSTNSTGGLFRTTSMFGSEPIEPESPLYGVLV